MKRLRLGIILVLVSWLPFAQLGLMIAHDNGLLTGEGAAQKFRLVVWTIQIMIGLVGVGLAGRVALDEAKQNGFRHTPASLWQLFWHGKQDTTPDKK